MDDPSLSTERRSPKRSRRRNVQLTPRDLELLSFVGEHRLVLGAHVQALLGVSAAAAYARLHALTTAGYLASEKKFDGQPACYQVTRMGLAAVGRRGSKPHIDLNCYRHDVGVAWLWLAARSGVWGPMREVVAERQLRSSDASPDREGEPFGVRLGGLGPAGRERLHYPDLVLITPEGKRIAIELELTGKGRTKREKILGGYSMDARIDAVLYLVDQRPVGRAIQASARRLGISSMVHVQPVQWGGSSTRGAVAAAQRSHAPPQSEVER